MIPKDPSYHQQNFLPKEISHQARLCPMFSNVVLEPFIVQPKADSSDGCANVRDPSHKIGPKNNSLYSRDVGEYNHQEESHAHKMSTCCQIRVERETPFKYYRPKCGKLTDR